MARYTRRDFFKWTALSAAAGCPGQGEASLPGIQGTGEHAYGTPAPEATPPAEIYRLLGFSSMSGEDPLKLWARLRNTQEWLVGPLSPDAWAGQAFIADHADIFAFRFLSIPPIWMQEFHGGNGAEFCAARFKTWFAKWPQWWRTVGPKAWDNSYARLIWQMPEGGAEVTYEWAQTDRNEVVCRITQSLPSDLVMQAYTPWDWNSPQLSVLYSDSADHRFLRGRSWVPGTRDGMRWVLALSTPADQTAGSGTIQWHGLFRGVQTFHLCGRQGQSYEALEEATRRWLEPGRIDDLLEHNREKYLRARPTGGGWLADVPAAINDQLEWSEVYTPSRRHAYITVSRHWAQENNSAPDFLWDGFFSALLVCQEDQAKSFNLVRDITSWQNDQGMFTQYGQWPSHVGTSIFPVAWGHTQYPVGARAGGAARRATVVRDGFSGRNSARRVPPR